MKKITDYFYGYFTFSSIATISLRCEYLDITKCPINKEIHNCFVYGFGVPSKFISNALPSIDRVAFHKLAGLKYTFYFFIETTKYMKYFIHGNFIKIKRSFLNLIPFLIAIYGLKKEFKNKA
ncbi:MAG: hypothetical protein LWW95_08255 [Candidatus Desulfofervidus auxilii]|nr:hypothetical protein [Candidatus Desulfofervidus auxilii]